jgi:hypothetical protein
MFVPNNPIAHSGYCGNLTQCYYLSHEIKFLYRKNMMKKLIKSFLLIISIMIASPAFATTEGYGTLLAGTYQPSSTFASLSVTGSGNVYNFTLTAYDLNSIFTSGAFVSAVAVDTNTGTLPIVSGVSGGSPVSVQPSNGPLGQFDFWFDLTGPKKARLTANESVSWVATFAQPVSFEGNEFALHVQGLTTLQGGSAWYVNNTTPVPEPETYGMLIVGLALVSFMAKRKNT